MSHAAVPEDVHHRHRPHLHHPNHRHAVPLRPILHRRSTASHSGRQSSGHPQARVRLSMRRNSDPPRRSDDPYASVIAAVSQARAQIRSYERESHGGDVHSPVDRPSARTFGISDRNLDLEGEPTREPRHVPGTPYPQQRHLYSSQLEQQQPPPPNLSQPASAPMIHPFATAPPPVVIPHQTMPAYQVPPASSGPFYQQAQRPSPFVVPTPLIPMQGVFATPLGASSTLPSSWAPATPQVSAAYVPSPATSLHNFQAAPSAPGLMGWPPQPQPGTPAAAFWPMPAQLTPNIPTTPFTPGQTMALPGGLPVPGTQPFWTPGEPWPPSERTLPLHLAPWLAPNPVSADRPHVVWDISDPPSKAKRISGHDVFVDMTDAFSSNTPAVFPETNEIIIMCNSGLAQQEMWPPIRIRKNKVTCGDVFWEIYQYFQKPISCDEVNIIKGRSEDEYRRLLEACYRRCSRAPGLADITRRQGVKRVDCLEDRTAWWGMWPVWAMDGTWSLHLGLMASSRA